MATTAAGPAVVPRQRLAARHLSAALAVAVFAAALAARLVAFAGVADDPARLLAPDSAAYLMMAASLARGEDFSGTIRPPFAPAPLPVELERTPVYPAFVAAVDVVAGDDPRAVVLAQCALGALTAALALALALVLGLGRPAGALAGLVVAFDPASIDAGLVVLTETIATALLVAGLLVLAFAWRRRAWGWLIAAGLLLGLGTLARPIGIALPLALTPLFPLAFGRRRATLAALAVFLAAGLVLPAAWAVRNGVERGDWTVSTIADYNLTHYLAAPVAAEAGGTSWDAARAALQEAVDRAATARHLAPAQARGYGRRQALAVLLAHPRVFARQYAMTAAWVLLDPGAVGWRALLTAAIILAAALTGLFRWWREGERGPLLALLLTLAYFLALSGGLQASARFRVPLVPFLALLAGASLMRHQYTRTSPR